MEKWLEHLCELIAYRLEGEVPPYCSLLEDDILFWWKSTIMSLIEFKTIKGFRLGNLTEVVFRLGDFRINVYTKEGGTWMDCKWTPIEPQKNEMENTAEAFVATLKVRFTEHKELEGTRISDWIVKQCRKRNLPYKFPSFL